MKDQCPLCDMHIKTFFFFITLSFCLNFIRKFCKFDLYAELHICRQAATRMHKREFGLKCNI